MINAKRMLAAGEVVRVFALGQLASLKLVEVVGRHKAADALWLDAEHAGLTIKDVEALTLAASASGLESFVRLPPTDYASVMRMLEAGAGGLMFSMVESAAEAERAVRWAKFAPRGTRGLNGGNRDGAFGLEPLAEYVRRANAETFVGVQIETVGALADLEGIVAVPDVDLLFVGPSDLSQVLGVPGEFEHPKCIETIERLASVCRSMGKPWGAFSRGPEYATRMATMGCQLFVIGSDLSIAHSGLRAMKEAHAKLGH